MQKNRKKLNGKAEGQSAILPPWSTTKLFLWLSCP